MITFANLRMFFLTFMLIFLRMRYILHPPTVATFQKVDAACARIASLSEPELKDTLPYFTPNFSTK